MKRLVPLIALVPLIVSIPVSGHFVYPILAMFILLAVRFGLGMLLRAEALFAPLGLFFLAPTALIWAISERKEGREFWIPLLWVELGLATIGTLWLLNSGKLEKRHVSLIVVSLLIWSLTYFGGSSGGAENMRPYYSKFGLSPEATFFLIACTRKVIHAAFYSTVATQIYLYYKGTTDRDISLWKTEKVHAYLPGGSLVTDTKLAVQFAIETALIIAVCDEWRQNMMPNREGSYRDVLLDIGAASFWLWWRYLRTNSARQEALDSDSQT